MNINIIGSGSSGNCIIFDNKIMLDAGLSFNKIKDYIDGVEIVLLTHCHADHLNITTIRKLYINNENIKFCCGEFLKDKLIGIPEKNIIIVEAGKLCRKGDLIFSPVNLYHDVPNFGYRIIKGEYKHFHATDTAHLKGITAVSYDSATIEANHEINAANYIIEQAENSGEFTHLRRAIKTHLSVDNALEFIDKNNIKKFIPVHIGSSTREQVINLIKERCIK